MGCNIFLRRAADAHLHRFCLFLCGWVGGLWGGADFNKNAFLVDADPALSQCVVSMGTHRQVRMVLMQVGRVPRPGWSNGSGFRDAHSFGRM